MLYRLSTVAVCLPLLLVCRCCLPAAVARLLLVTSAAAYICCRLSTAVACLPLLVCLCLYAVNCICCDIYAVAYLPLLLVFPLLACRRSYLLWHTYAVLLALDWPGRRQLEECPASWRVQKQGILGCQCRQKNVAKSSKSGGKGPRT